MYKEKQDHQWVKQVLMSVKNLQGEITTKSSSNEGSFMEKMNLGIIPDGELNLDNRRERRSVPKTANTSAIVCLSADLQNVERLKHHITGLGHLLNQELANFNFFCKRLDRKCFRLCIQAFCQISLCHFFNNTLRI